MFQLQCIVVTPDKAVLDELVDFVVLPLYDGEIGIAPRHAPMIGRLGYGQMRITHGGQVSRYSIEGGFVEVIGDVVSVLTNRSEPVEKPDESFGLD